LAQSTYHGSKRQGTDCNKGSVTREELSPPAFLGANLTASHYLLIQELRVGGRTRADRDYRCHLLILTEPVAMKVTITG
jgi:hypothetical protein